MSSMLAVGAVNALRDHVQTELTEALAQKDALDLRVLHLQGLLAGVDEQIDETVRTAVAAKMVDSMAPQSLESVVAEALARNNEWRARHNLAPLDKAEPKGYGTCGSAHVIGR